MLGFIFPGQCCLCCSGQEAQSLWQDAKGKAKKGQRAPGGSKFTEGMYTTENVELKAAYEESLEHLESVKKENKALQVKYWFDVPKFCTS